MKKIELKKQQNLDSILQTALELFQSRGFIGTSMDKIAEQAGVTKQTVYRYFKSKEDLFQRALEAERQHQNFHFLEALEQEDVTAALQGFAEGFIAKHVSPGHMATMRLLVAEGPVVPEITRAFYAMGPRLTRERLARFLRERCQVADAETADIAIEVFLDMLHGMRMPVLIGLRPVPTPAEIHQQAERAVQVLWQLLHL